MSLQPNIVLCLPQQYDNIIDINNNRNSPIKSLHKLYDIDAVTADYLTLFGNQNCNQNEYVSQRNSRKLNIGEKIKNKLQSTNNKSSRVLSNPQLNVSQFQQGNSSSQQSKLYENSYELHRQQKQQKISQFQLNIQNQKQQFSDIGSSAKRQNPIMKLYRQSLSNSFHESSPYNNISAKTQQSPSDIHCSMSINSQNQNTPINHLNSMSAIDTPVSLPHQLHLYQHLTGNISNFQYPVNNAPLIKLRQVQQQVPSIQIKDVPMVSSRSIDMQHRQKIQNVQSVCIPYDEDHQQNESTGYQYAIKQLKKLQQNVYQLEIATRNLENIKAEQNSKIFPSHIDKIQSMNKLNQSFLQFFQENLKGIFYEPQQKQSFLSQQLLNQKSAEFCSQENLKNKRNNQQYLCQTPNRFKLQKQQINKQCKKSQKFPKINMIKKSNDKHHLNNSDSYQQQKQSIENLKDREQNNFRQFKGLTEILKNQTNLNQQKNTLINQSLRAKNILSQRLIPNIVNPHHSLRISDKENGH